MVLDKLEFVERIDDHEGYASDPVSTERSEVTAVVAYRSVITKAVVLILTQSNLVIASLHSGTHNRGYYAYIKIGLFEHVEISSAGLPDVNMSVSDPYGLARKAYDSLNEIFLMVVSLNYTTPMRYYHFTHIERILIFIGLIITVAVLIFNREKQK